MSDDLPFDPGVLMGSTNESIWAENTAKHPGARALRLYYAKAGKPEGKTARQMFQARLGLAPIDKVVAMLAAMAPYDGQPLAEIEKAYAGFLINEIAATRDAAPPSLGRLLSLLMNESP